MLRSHWLRDALRLQCPESVDKNTFMDETHGGSQKETDALRLVHYIRHNKNGQLPLNCWSAITGLTQIGRESFCHVTDASLISLSIFLQQTHNVSNTCQSSADDVLHRLINVVAERKITFKQIG